MRSFIIHMSSATARRPNVERLLKTLPNAQVVEAVRGVDAIAAGDIALRPGDVFRPKYPFALNPGEVGCFLSHRACWQLIKEGADDFALVVEDDAAIDDVLWQDVMQLVENTATKDSYFRLPAKTRETGAIEAQNGAVRLIRPRRIGLQTVAQVVGRNAAARLLDASDVIDRPVDAFLQMSWAARQDVHTILPSAISEQTEQLGGSTIQKKSPSNAWFTREMKRALYRARVAWRSRQNR